MLIFQQIVNYFWKNKMHYMAEEESQSINHESNETLFTKGKSLAEYS